MQQVIILVIKSNVKNYLYLLFGVMFIRASIRKIKVMITSAAAEMRVMYDINAVSG